MVRLDDVATIWTHYPIFWYKEHEASDDENIHPMRFEHITQYSDIKNMKQVTMKTFILC